MSKAKIVGIMPVYNEADILEQTIEYMVEQGIPLIIIEGQSTDGSLDIEKKFLGRGVLEIHTVPSTPYHDRKAVLSEAYDRASRYFPDWVVYSDADEFLESPLPSSNLSQAIEAVELLGYNLIQFNCFEFVLTEKNYRGGELDVRKRMKFYSWQGDYYFRAWKNYPGTDLIPSGGHKPVFPRDVEERIFPAKFVLRHYKFRSLEQGMRKVFKERLPRYDPKNRAIGWHVHYNNMKPDPDHFLFDSLKLNQYDEDGRWNLERKVDTYFGAWTPTQYLEEHLPVNEQIAKVSGTLEKNVKELSTKIDTLDANMHRQFDAIYRFPIVRLYLGLKKLVERVREKQPPRTAST